MNVGKYVRKERIKRGMTQKELAYALSLTDVTISNIENNKHIGRKSIYAISKYFGIGVDELIVNHKQV